MIAITTRALSCPQGLWWKAMRTLQPVLISRKIKLQNQQKVKITDVALTHSLTQKKHHHSHYNNAFRHQSKVTEENEISHNYVCLSSWSIDFLQSVWIKLHGICNRKEIGLRKDLMVRYVQPRELVSDQNSRAWVQQQSKQIANSGSREWKVTILWCNDLVMLVSIS